MDDQEHKTCLFLTSSDAAKTQVANTIHHALDELSIKVLQFNHSPQTNGVLDTIKSADLIVADLSGNNPNVIYELGFAHALHKPTILIKEKEQDELRIPFDLRGSLYIPYDVNNLTRLHDHLQKLASLYIADEKETS